jgi:hypothetical protein
MNHLTPDEFIDAVGQTLPPARQAHLHACEDCRLQVAQMTAMVREVRDVAVPAPSPLFWGHLSDRVRRAIAVEPAVPPAVARWFQWPVLVPLGALASLVLVLASAVPQRVVQPRDDGMAVAAIDDLHDADAPVDPEAHWELMAALIANVDFDADQSAMGGAPGAADAAVTQLTAAEQQELLRLLREELQHSGG